MSFFETTRWRGLAEPNRRISTLRHRLSEVLFEQITKELPAMISEILMSIKDTRAELTRMGRSRSNDLEKRLFLIELAQTFSSCSHAACEALYDHPFFTDRGTADTQPRRLRSSYRMPTLRSLRECCRSHRVPSQKVNQCPRYRPAVT